MSRTTPTVALDRSGSPEPTRHPQTRGNVVYLPERRPLQPERTLTPSQTRARDLAAKQLRIETADAGWRAIHRLRAREAARAALSVDSSTGAPA